MRHTTTFTSRLREDTGAISAEYVGILVLVVVMVMVLVNANLGDRLDTIANNQIEDIEQAGGGSGGGSNGGGGPTG